MPSRRPFQCKNCTVGRFGTYKQHTKTYLKLFSSQKKFWRALMQSCQPRPHAQVAQSIKARAGLGSNCTCIYINIAKKLCRFCDKLGYIAGHKTNKINSTTPAGMRLHKQAASLLLVHVKVNIYT